MEEDSENNHKILHDSPKWLYKIVIHIFHFVPTHRNRFRELFCLKAFGKEGCVVIIIISPDIYLRI